MHEAPKTLSPAGQGRQYDGSRPPKRDQCYPILRSNPVLQRIPFHARIPFRKSIQVPVEESFDVDQEARAFKRAKKTGQYVSGKVIVTHGVYNKRGVARKVFPLPRGVSYNELKRPRPFKLPYFIYRELFDIEGLPRPAEEEISDSDSEQPAAEPPKVQPWKVMRRNAYVKLNPPPKARDMAMCVCEPGFCDEDCLNRASFIECDPTCCPSGLRDCSNRAIQELTAKLAVHPESIGIKIVSAGSKGHGLFATRDFAPHELILEYTGDVIDSSEMERRLVNDYRGSDRFYCLSLGQGLAIDSGRRGSEARFVNHSCNPNSEMQKWFVKGVPRVGLFAGERGVSAGTEFTYDYNFDVFTGAMAQKCYCGELTCRGIIGKRPPKSNSSGQLINEATTAFIPVETNGENPPVRVRIVLNKSKPVTPGAVVPLKRSLRRQQAVMETEAEAEAEAEAVSNRRGHTLSSLLNPPVSPIVRELRRLSKPRYRESVSSDDDETETGNLPNRSFTESPPAVSDALPNGEQEDTSMKDVTVSITSEPSAIAEALVDPKTPAKDQEKAISPDAVGPSTEVPLLVPSPMGMVWQMFRVTPINKPVDSSRTNMLQGISLSSPALNSPAVMGISANISGVTATPTPSTSKVTASNFSPAPSSSSNPSSRSPTEEGTTDTPKARSTRSKGAQASSRRTSRSRQNKSSTRRLSRPISPAISASRPSLMNGNITSFSIGSHQPGADRSTWNAEPGMAHRPEYVSNIVATSTPPPDRSQTMPSYPQVPPMPVYMRQSPYPVYSPVHPVGPPDVSHGMNLPKAPNPMVMGSPPLQYYPTIHVPNDGMGPLQTPPVVMPRHGPQ
ncbi:Histone-lysine N-methyltransferase ASH1L [Wickerhamiella sorbophila]|uniref:Histone-lysine N-methyltransferase ASH1L n=1 Tax=Wickerhamiella sorbophila TaxID=45607 RepID=A0A2T0FLC7_9ASCO|nr:Histone-lysine N-methyltransferase ASH1L [Wickerhamiella sorbophila]PRT55798.1 Histone-lysine N-methyltransferase ASH1L [Wickerhamiella sorbophila]